MKAQRLNILLISIIASIFIISMVSAQVETSGTYKQGSCVELKQTCSNCSMSNISSIISPNSSNLIPNELVMVKNGVEFTYNCFGFSEIGTYIINGHSDVDGVDTVWAYDLQVTTTGNNMSLSLWVSLIIIILSIVFLIIAISADNEYLGFLSSIGFILSGVLVMTYGFGSVNDLYTRSIALITLGMGFITLFVSAFKYEGYHSFGEYFGGEKAEVDEYDYYQD